MTGYIYVATDNCVDIVFDPAKDALNIGKHGLSLAAAKSLDVLAVVPDNRFAGEQRYRLHGMLDGAPHRLAEVLRDDIVRAISFRRTHAKEYRRHVR